MGASNSPRVGERKAPMELEEIQLRSRLRITKVDNMQRIVSTPYGCRNGQTFLQLYETEDKLCELSSKTAIDVGHVSYVYNRAGYSVRSIRRLCYMLPTWDQTIKNHSPQSPRKFWKICPQWEQKRKWPRRLLQTSPYPLWLPNENEQWSPKEHDICPSISSATPCLFSK